MRVDPRRILRDLGGLLVWLVVCFVPAVIGVMFLPGEWYMALRKPAWNPPAWLFGPVWTALYTTMAVSAWLVWRKGGFRLQRSPLTLFLVQLALNAVWSPLFFGLKRTGWAFAEIVILWLAIVWTIRAFARVHRVAAALLVPYLAWVGFASVLNGTLWWLNRP
jgi:tryptophan-rich sensory protein